MDLRLSVAVAAGHATGLLSRRLGIGGGTTFPGDLASRLDPAVPAKLASRLSRGCAIVTGTNGKTTTSRLIANILRAAGWRTVHNRAGANLLSGVTSALMGQASLRGRDAAEFGLFEVDEAAMPLAAERLDPRVVVVTNLFRDQLDRYGEVDYLAGLWRRALAALPGEAIAVLNADDPLVASLGNGIAARVLYFGLEDDRLGKEELDHAADSKACLVCGLPYKYTLAYYGHLGHYSCPNCGAARPTPLVAARRVELDGVDGTRLDVVTPSGDLAPQLRLPGLYNAYNALAAIAAALALEIEPAVIQNGVQGFSAAFGRIERVPVGDRTVFLALVKNPVGFNQVLRTLLAGPEPKPLVILINDHFADGTDISWLWDVDFELLRDRTSFVVAGGTRAEDMLVRLKYAGVPTDGLVLARAPEAALRAALERVPAGGTVYVLPTYTAMLEVRGALSAWGYVERFWEN